MTDDGLHCEPVASDGAVPTCSTSPLGRFTWTLRELTSLFKSRNRPGAKEVSDDAR